MNDLSQKVNSVSHSPYFKKIFALLSIVVIALGSFLYWLYSQYYVSTDDSYLNANIVQIAPRVTGQVTHLYITNNQYVKAGQPLFTLDTQPFFVAVDRARAQLAYSRAQLRNAQIISKRTMPLVQQRALALQEGDNVSTSVLSAAANVRIAEANLKQALLDLHYTQITAPTSGRLANVSLREGNVVSANVPLFALISDKEYWVDANFKETDLGSIRVGQHADISVDVYPDKQFNGIVESISGGAGTVFSLLPPQNATGNWVKITQRVPVRVHIIDPDVNHPLQIGTSATVIVHLKSSAPPLHVLHRHLKRVFS